MRCLRKPERPGCDIIVGPLALNNDVNVEAKLRLRKRELANRRVDAGPDMAPARERVDDALPHPAHLPRAGLATKAG